MNAPKAAKSSAIYLLASYPKSGNTWVRALIHAFDRGARDIDINDLFEFFAIMHRSMFDDMLEIDSADLTIAEVARMRPSLHRMLRDETTGLRWFKSHDANLPAPGARDPPFTADMLGGVVLIVRDPRDVVPSLADHLGKSLDRAIAIMADSTHILAESHNRGQIPHLVSSWSGFYRSWLDTPDVPRLTLRYEDLLDDTEIWFSRLLAFADIDAGRDRIQDAVHAARFEMMAEQEARHGFRELSPTARTRFFREGRAGGWRKVLTPDQAGHIERDHGEMMQHFGYLA